MIEWSQYGAREKLLKLIQNRETDDNWVMPDANGNFVVEKIKIYIQDSAPGLPEYHKDSVELRIHADTRCTAIANFLKKATSESVCIIEGPRSGHRLGLDGGYDSHLNIFVLHPRTETGKK